MSVRSIFNKALVAGALFAVGLGITSTSVQAQQINVNQVIDSKFIGMNLASYSYYGTITPLGPFINLMKHSGSASCSGKWGSGIGWGGCTKDLKIDINGYVTELNPQHEVNYYIFSNTSSSAHPKMQAEIAKRKFKFTYKGNGGTAGDKFFRFNGANVESENYTPNGGEVVFGFTNSNPNLYITLQKIDPTNYPKDFVLTEVGAGQCAISKRYANASMPCTAAEGAMESMETLLSQGQILHPLYKQVRNSIGTGPLRFMGALQTNDIDAQHKYTKQTCLGGLNCINYAWDKSFSLHAMAKIANELERDVWYNYPTKTDDGNVVNYIATTFAQNLNPGRKLYIELSNENWNFGYPYALNMEETQKRGCAKFGTNSNGTHECDPNNDGQYCTSADKNGNAQLNNNICPGRGRDYFGWASTALFKITHDVFKAHGREADLVPVLGSFNAGPWLTQELLANPSFEAGKTVCQSMKQYPNARVATGPYTMQYNISMLSDPGKYNPQNALVDFLAKPVGEFFARHTSGPNAGKYVELTQPVGHANTNHGITYWTQEHIKFLKACNDQAAISGPNHPIKLTVYEGNIHITNYVNGTENQTNFFNKMKQILNDPRMKDFFKEYLITLRDLGMVEYVHYASESKHAASHGGSFGTPETIADHIRINSATGKSEACDDLRYAAMYELANGTACK